MVAFACKDEVTEPSALRVFSPLTGDQQTHACAGGVLHLSTGGDRSIPASCRNTSASEALGEGA